MRFVAFVVLLSACVSVPAFHGPADDASNGSGDGPDASPGPLAVRLIGNAFREGGNDGTAAGTYMMTKAGYGIPTAGIVAGDLVLFIANVDNGQEPFWNPPTGFMPIVNRTYGMDGQSYVIAWKIAGTEPQFYTGMYGPASTSAAATVSLLAVTGYDATNPIETFLPTDHQTPTNPADLGSPGITTNRNNSMLIFAGGGDWTPENGTSTFAEPAGFQLITSVGDRDTHWDWTNQVIAYKMQAQAGPTGALTSTLTAHVFGDPTTPIPGGGWDVLFAIAPHS